MVKNTIKIATAKQHQNPKVKYKRPLRPQSPGPTPIPKGWQKSLLKIEQQNSRNYSTNIEFGNHNSKKTTTTTSNDHKTR